MASRLNKLKAAAHTMTGQAGDVRRVLTVREKQLAQLIADGHGNRDIAAALGVSSKTVEAHRSNMYKKLRVKNTAQLIQVGVAMKLIAIRPPKVA